MDIDSFFENKGTTLLTIKDFAGQCDDKNVQFFFDECFNNELQAQNLPQSDNNQILDCLSQALCLDTSYIIWVVQNDPCRMQRLLRKAKIVLKRQKTKLRLKMKDMKKEEFTCEPKTQEIKLEYLSSEQSTCSDRKVKFNDNQSLCSSNGDNQKKIVQMIRNRISAQNSRDKKKQYLQSLEDAVSYHQIMNLNLKKQLLEMERQNNLIQMENSILKNELHVQDKTVKKIKTNNSYEVYDNMSVKKNLLSSY